MPLRFHSLTPIEAEYYAGIPELREIVDTVGDLIMDLHDEEIHLDIVLAMNDENDPNYFTLAFGGTTLSLDFSPDKIDVTDFDLSDGDSEEVIESFGREEVGKATLWLVNKLEE